MMAGMNSLHIFRAGTHTDVNGNKVTLTEADIAASAAAYDPAKHEAPIVIGHPKLDAPAYGWVQSLSASGPDLEAVPAQVPVAFSEIVTAGAYKKISASFYPPAAPGNPVPGVWYLKHVGFLGATPPAVKGLRQAAFAAGDDGAVEFADWSLRTQASLWRRLRDWIIGEKGQEVADQIIPDYAIDELRDEANRPDPQIEPLPTNQPSSFSETTTVTPEQAAAIQAENDRLKSELTQSRAADAKRDADARHAGNVAFAEAQIAARQLAPKHKDAVVAFLDFAETPAADGGVVSFGEGEEKQPLAAAFKAFVTDLPKVVSFGERATKDRAASADAVNPLVADAQRRNQSNQQ